MDLSPKGLLRKSFTHYLIVILFNSVLLIIFYIFAVSFSLLTLSHILDYNVTWTELHYDCKIQYI